MAEDRIVIPLAMRPGGMSPKDTFEELVIASAYIAARATFLMSLAALKSGCTAEETVERIDRVLEVIALNAKSLAPQIHGKVEFGD